MKKEMSHKKGYVYFVLLLGSMAALLYRGYHPVISFICALLLALSMKCVHFCFRLWYIYLNVVFNKKSFRPVETVVVRVTTTAKYPKPCPIVKRLDIKNPKESIHINREISQKFNFQIGDHFVFFVNDSMPEELFYKEELGFRSAYAFLFLLVSLLPIIAINIYIYDILNAW